MKLVKLLLLLVWSGVALAEIVSVRIVENEATVKHCEFVGQISASNGLFQIKTANRILQDALREAAEAGADTAIVRKSAHSGVLVDAYKCQGTSAAAGKN